MTHPSKDKAGAPSESLQGMAAGVTEAAHPTFASTARRPSGSQRLSPEVQSMLGSKLRNMYGKLIDEPIPAPLVELLQRLEAQQARDTQAEETAP